MKTKNQDTEREQQLSLQGINKALNNGRILYAFTSSLAVRVVRIEDYYHGPERGVGEGSSLIEALQNAAKNYLTNGKQQGQQYGCGGCQVDDSLDGWISKCGKFMARKTIGGITFEATGWTQTKKGYWPVIESVTRGSFEEAYVKLCELVTERSYVKLDIVTIDPEKTLIPLGW